METISRSLIIEQPELIDDVMREAKKIIEFGTYCKQLNQLTQYEDWSKFDWTLLCNMANPVDNKFVKLMLSLSKHHYHYSAVSFHRWWRRLKAVNQQNIITFFTFQNFKQPCHIHWDEVYQHCFRTADMFTMMADSYKSDRNVEMNLRAMLGCSQAADIKQAWINWAKRNHPDKGGNIETFILAKAAYEEWAGV